MKQQTLNIPAGESVNCFPLQKTIWDYPVKMNICLAYRSVYLFLGLYPGMMSLKLQATD